MLSTIEDLGPALTSTGTVVVAGATGERILREKFAGRVVNVVRVPAGEPGLFALPERSAVPFEDVQTVVALGGGSVLDSAKLLMVRHQFPELWDGLELHGTAKAIAAMSLAFNFIAIPTTIGSGAEVSSSAIVNVSGSKVPVVGVALRPDVIVCDPSLVSKVASDHKSGLIDIIAHSFESLLSRRSSEFLESLALQTLKIVSEMVGRERYSTSEIVLLQMAGIHAGWCQDHRLVSIPHAIAHQFPQGRHGERVGTYLAPFIEQMADVFPEEGETIRNLLLSAGLTPERLASCVRILLGGQTQPSSGGEDEPFSDAVASRVIGDATLRLSALAVSFDTLRRFRFPTVGE